MRVARLPLEFNNRAYLHKEGWRGFHSGQIRRRPDREGAVRHRNQTPEIAYPWERGIVTGSYYLLDDLKFEWIAAIVVVVSDCVKRVCGRNGKLRVSGIVIPLATLFYEVWSRE